MSITLPDVPVVPTFSPDGAPTTPSGLLTS